MNINKVFLYGNLTRDPELRQTQNGKSVCSFSIATNRKWSGKNNEKEQDTQYHNIVAWGKVAELIEQYMKKGSGIFIEGRMQTRTYEKDGSKRYTTEVVAENMQFGNKPKNSSSSAPSQKEEDVPVVDQDEETIDPEDIF